MYMPSHPGTMSGKGELGCDSSQVRLHEKNLQGQESNCNRPLIAEQGRLKTDSD